MHSTSRACVPQLEDAIVAQHAVYIPFEAVRRGLQ